MKYMVEHPEVSRMIGKYGMANAHKNFSWGKIGRILYNEIVGESKK